MNKKGFTLVELLATLVILGIVFGLVIVGVNYNIKTTKEKAEDVFVDTIKDALNIYLNSPKKKDNNNNSLVFDVNAGFINKSLGQCIKVYKSNNVVTLATIINPNYSPYSPLAENDLVNPNNDKVKCNLNAQITLYRDEDYVYYYELSKSSLNCLTNSGNITNKPDFLTTEEINSYNCQ